MKTRIGRQGCSRGTYPKVAPEPAIYLPRVRMTPLGPAPYWKMVTVPSLCKLPDHSFNMNRHLGGHSPMMNPMMPPTAKPEPSAKAQKSMIIYSSRIHVLDPIIAPIFTKRRLASFFMLTIEHSALHYDARCDVIGLKTYSCQRSRDPQGPLGQGQQRQASCRASLSSTW